MGLYNKIIDLQKLQAAWVKVYRNKPAAGVDNITFEQFNAEQKVMLRELRVDLSNHEYETLPVKLVTLYKGEKAREIALYCMRDKVVQQSLATELNKTFDSKFSQQTYAYRNGKSALTALEEISGAVQNPEYKYYVKLDIEKFFDTIAWKKLGAMLKKEIQEEDVIELIRQNSCSKSLDLISGELIVKERGIYQGSGIAPVLSNIYLLEFDREICQEDVYFLRYSDDMVLLCKSEEQARILLGKISAMMQALSLKLNEKKSIVGEIENGFYFLGYHFDRHGKSITEKAREGLKERLEYMWITNNGIDFEDRIKKSVEIMNGWEQYFRGEHKPDTIIEYAAMVFMNKQKIDLHNIKENRLLLKNTFRDICIFLAKQWREKGFPEMELFEYENYCFNDTINIGLFENPSEEILDLYRKYLVQETVETATELMQEYTDIHEYEKAQFWHEKKNNIENTARTYVIPVISDLKKSDNITIDVNSFGKIIKTFVGREDIFARETLDHGGKRIVEMQTLPLTEGIIKKHLSGEATVSTYIQRPNSTVKFMVFDFDVSKKIILQYGRDTTEFNAYLEKTCAKACELLKLFGQLGLNGYLEFSGYRGYHVWLFFTEWVPVRYANMFFEIVQEKIICDDGISMEVFPNKTRVRDGKFGQCIKLPFGYHTKTCERSFFLDENMCQVTDVNMFIDGLSKISLSALKKILAKHSGISEKRDFSTLDENIEVFGDVSANVKEILVGCMLMRYLCQKSAKTGYLSHFERLSILYVFGHAGDEGKKFVHKIMSFTLNYQYNITEKFINKMPEKPVSCLKLREQYKMITAEYGCNCVFKRAKNCYPSPVLHAIVLSSDGDLGVTVPTSRTLTKEKERHVVESLNNCAMAETLALQIQEKKKQRRILDKAISKLERELGELFNEAGINSLELKMGVLVRRKTDTGYEWVIEL